MDKQTLIDQLVAQWKELRARGAETTAEELCRDHPELLETVQMALASQTSSRALVGQSLGSTLPLDSQATWETGQ